MSTRYHPFARRGTRLPVKRFGCWLQVSRHAVTLAAVVPPHVSMVLLVLALLSSATHGLGEYVGPDLVERLPTETDCGGPWIYASVCRDAHVLQQPFMCQVCRSWAALDRVVSAHNRNATKLSRLSGGISLHQAQLQAVQAIQLLQPIIKRNGAATVCETGFNAGHSALLFLALAYADAR